MTEPSSSWWKLSVDESFMTATLWSCYVFVNDFYVMSLKMILSRNNMVEIISKNKYISVMS